MSGTSRNNRSRLGNGSRAVEAPVVVGAVVEITADAAVVGCVAVVDG